MAATATQFVYPNDDLTFLDEDQHNKLIRKLDKLPLRHGSGTILIDVLSGTSATSSSSKMPPKNLLSRQEEKGRYSFKLVQSWEGVVEKVGPDEWTARIVDKTDKTRPDEEVVMDIDEVDPFDSELLVIGAVFYWSIGYYSTIGRPRVKESRIRFRRLPQWTSLELSNAKEEGRIIANVLSNAE